ncbi:MAG: hypothetical protein F9K30_13950 [Dechloromonas sp.]|nr:MAG: hypothetical protein F9K30_13950 [Dechloromonas sp.]
MPHESGSFVRDPVTGALKRQEGQTPARRLSIAERRDRETAAATAQSLADQARAMVGERAPELLEPPATPATPRQGRPRATGTTQNKD